MTDYDVAIIGGGPGGSTLGSLLAQQGHRVALFESEVFPRFKIGESLLPYSLDILRASGALRKIEEGPYIKKYGAQFIDHNHEEQVYFEFSGGLDGDHPYAFEVEREKFDLDLIEHTQSLGVKVFQPDRVQQVDFLAEQVVVKSEANEIKARFVVDASGRQSFLGNKLKQRSKHEDFNNIAVFGHYKNVLREVGRKEGDIIIGILPNQSWSWTIPFQGEITSVGVTFASSSYVGRKYDEKFLVEAFDCHPLLKSLMSEAQPVREVQVVSNYSHSCQRFIGQQWMALGDAACFLDPVFSSGVHISLTSALLASRVLHESLAQGKVLNETLAGQNYEPELRKGIHRFRKLLHLFYEGGFVPKMLKVLNKPNMLSAFTSAVGGDMWNDANILFKMGVLDHGGA